MTSRQLKLLVVLVVAGLLAGCGGGGVINTPPPATDRIVGYWRATQYSSSLDPFGKFYDMEKAGWSAWCQVTAGLNYTRQFKTPYYTQKETGRVEMADSDRYYLCPDTGGRHVLTMVGDRFYTQYRKREPYVGYIVLLWFEKM